MKLASRFGRINQVRRDRPLTREELMQFVPSVFSEDKHESRSERYTYIPTITLLDNLQREGFRPFFACQTRVPSLIATTRSLTVLTVSCTARTVEVNTAGIS